MADRSGILFYGDAHGAWGNLFDEYARRPAHAVVLLGDCGLNRPLHEVLEPISSDGCPVFWIYGNLDNGSEEQWAYLAKAEGGLHGNVANIGGTHVAGLGGTYAGRVWYPRRCNEAAAFRTRREWLRAIPRHERCGKLLPLERDGFTLNRDSLVGRGVIQRAGWAEASLDGETLFNRPA